MVGTRNDAVRFAQGWVAAWNAGDVDAVVARFAEDAEFTSPRALEIVGTATVDGRAALHAYWTAALAAAGSVQFRLDDVVWDAERRTLVVLYASARGGRETRACEVMVLGDDGLVRRGEALYGALQSPPCR